MNDRLEPRGVDEMLKKVEHIGIAVRNLDRALEIFHGLLGIPIARRSTEESQGVKVAFLNIGDSELELLEPIDNDSYVGKYIAKHGEGIHHICFEVEDIEQATVFLKSQEVRTIQERPNQVDGPGPFDKFIFCHPKDFGNVLVELVTKK